MFVNAILLYTLIAGSLLGVLPESFDLLVLGFGLIAITSSLRWLMKKRNQKVRIIEEESLHISI
jgi:hypothetical protein